MYAQINYRTYLYNVIIWYYNVDNLIINSIKFNLEQTSTTFSYFLESGSFIISIKEKELVINTKRKKKKEKERGARTNQGEDECNGAAGTNLSTVKQTR